jgi:transposase
MSQNLSSAIAAIGIDIGKNSFHVVGLDARGAILLRQKWSRGQVEGRLANMPPCLIGMEACVGAHHLSRKLKAFGHDARLMPAKYVRLLTSVSTRPKQSNASLKTRFAVFGSATSPFTVTKFVTTWFDRSRSGNDPIVAIPKRLDECCPNSP